MINFLYRFREMLADRSLCQYPEPAWRTMRHPQPIIPTTLGLLIAGAFLFWGIVLSVAAAAMAYVAWLFFSACLGF
jgi:hypothetical protein